MAKSGYAFAALVVALVAAALVVRPWLGAQGRALVVVGTTVHAPGFTWLVKRVTDAPRLTEEIIGGVTATVVRPKTRAPVIVLFTGAAERGRRDPNVRALAEGFARSGYVVVLPDLPGLTRGELTLRTVRAAETVATESKAVAFFGLSTGGAVAMLVAERRSMRDRVRVVAAMGAFTDIRAVLRLATTHTYRVGLRLVPYRSKAFLGLVAGRSLVAALPPSRDRASVLDVLAHVHREARDPLARVRGIPRATLAPPARAVVALLANRDPRRFDVLYRALPARVRDTCRKLSPLADAESLRAPVLLAADPRDAYFPRAQALDLAAAAPRGVVSAIRTASHGGPHAFPQGLLDVVRLDAFLVRALRLASA